MADVEEPVDDIVADEEAEEVEEEEEEEFVAVGATEVKLFGKWSFDDIEIRDISLEVSAEAIRLEESIAFDCDVKILRKAFSVILLFPATSTF
jgi:hypothetical protein